MNPHHRQLHKTVCVHVYTHIYVYASIDTCIYIYIYIYIYTYATLDVGTESVDLLTPLRKVGSSIPDRIKAITYKIGTRRDLTLCSTLPG